MHKPAKVSSSLTFTLRRAHGRKCLKKNFSPHYQPFEVRQGSDTKPAVYTWIHTVPNSSKLMDLKSDSTRHRKTKNTSYKLNKHYLHIHPAPLETPISQCEITVETVFFNAKTVCIACGNSVYWLWKQCRLQPNKSALISLFFCAS